MATRTSVATLWRGAGSLAVQSVAFSPDSHLLAAGGGNGEITLWDAVTRTTLKPLAGSGSVTAVVFSPDGQDLVTSGSNRALEYWNVATHAFTGGTMDPDTNLVQSLAFSPDGHTLVLGSAEGALMLPFHTVSLLAPEPLTSVALSPHTHLIATTGPADAVRLWNAATLEPARVLTAQGDGANSVAFSPDGHLIAAAGAGGYVRVWDPTTGIQLAALPTLGPAASKAVFSPDGSLLAAASAAALDAANRPGGIQVWDIRTGKLLASRLDNNEVAGPAFSPNGSLLAYGTSGAGSDGAVSQVLLLNARTLRQVEALPSIPSQVQDVAFGPDGQSVAAGYENGTVRIWNLRDRQPAITIQVTTGEARDIAFSPDGQTLAIGSTDDLVRLVDVRTSTVIAELEGHSNQVNDVTFSPDGQTLISASGDETALLWNLVPGRAVQRLCQNLSGPSLASQWANLHSGLGPPLCSGSRLSP
jgi:WD40 repeat protein